MNKFKVGDKITHKNGKWVDDHTVFHVAAANGDKISITETNTLTGDKCTCDEYHEENFKLVQ